MLLIDINEIRSRRQIRFAAIEQGIHFRGQHVDALMVGQDVVNRHHHGRFLLTLEHVYPEQLALFEAKRLEIGAAVSLRRFPSVTAGFDDL